MRWNENETLSLAVRVAKCAVSEIRMTTRRQVEEDGRTCSRASDASAAIVCTLLMPKHAHTTVRSFLAYHLGVGFEHVFLFFDDPKDATIADAETFGKEKVTVLKRTSDLKETLRKRCKTWADLGAFYEEEVQARQSLNAELALHLAKEKNVGWLLHIDSDELFYVGKETSIRSHFETLNRKGIYQLTYTNHEGVPEKHDVKDYFKEITLFRRHFFHLGMSAEVRDAMKWWESRTQHGQYFLAYDNGKSATRVVDGVLPKSVHSWKLPPALEHKSFTTLVDPRSLDLSRVYSCEEPCILHYVVCGFDWFWSKYEILGEFPSSWFGGAMPIAPCFHLDSRDVFAEGRQDVAKMFYEREVLLDPIEHDAVRREHLERGVLFRTTVPRDLLRLESGEESERCVASKEESDESTSREETKSGRGEIANATATCDTTRPPTAPSTTPYTYDKAWMLSNIAKDFLMNAEARGES